MKKIVSIILAFLTALTMAMPAMAEEADANAPKYVFMFIGDGMGSPQISMAEYYKGNFVLP